MTKWDEEKLENFSQQLDHISVPKNALQQARLNAQRRHQRDRKKIRRTWQSVALVAVILLVFVTSVRISPAFANAVAKIPGLSPIVHLIAFDKGLADIVDNEYYEEIMISDTQNDMTFTLLGVIADESGMLLSYKIAAPFDLQHVGLGHVELMHGDAEIDAGTGHSWTGQHEPVYEIENTISVTAFNLLDYTKRDFELRISFENQQEVNFMIPFTLKEDIVKTKQFMIHEKVVIDGQVIEVEDLKISPLRAEIKLAVDPDNTMQVLQFNGLKLVDEKGEDWGTIRNGSVGFGSIRDGEVIIFIQSNYFREPKELTLAIPEIEALPKGEDFITVDFDKKQVLYQPELLDITIHFKEANTFHYHYPYENGEVRGDKTLFSHGIDAAGKDVYMNSSWYSGNGGGYESGHSYEAAEGEITNPVELPIQTFHRYLSGGLEIEVPIQD